VFEVDGMPNRSGMGFCDYDPLEDDGKPLVVIEEIKILLV